MTEYRSCGCIVPDEGERIYCGHPLHDPNETLLTIEEAAAKIHVHERTIRRFISRGYLRAWATPSGRLLITQTALEGILRAR